MRSHLFISESDGNLYDTRKSNWAKKPLRKNFRRTHRTIKNVEDLKATLRNGPYAWPGGYPMYFIASDGAACSFEGIREELRNVIEAIKNNDNSGWRMIYCDTNYEDNNIFCAITNKKIESAYAEED